MKLSICIPTFERLSYVFNQVKDINNYFNKSELKFEIIVSDNCSNFDKDWLLFEKYCNKFNILFFKQKKNLGLIGNINFLLNKANGEYVWFLGDDDIVKKHTAVKLKNIFEKLNPDYIFLNHAAVKGEDRNQIVKTFDLKYFQGINSTGHYSLLQIFKKYGAINMFMSSNIYKRKKLLSRYNNYKKTEQIVDPFIYSVLMSEESTYIENEICIYDNFEFTSWKNNKRNVMSRIFILRLFDLYSMGDLKHLHLKELLNSHLNSGVGNVLWFLYFSNKEEKKLVLNFLGLSESFKLVYIGFFKILKNFVKKLSK